MAISSNPNSRSNSSPRNSEANSPMRRSFNGSPFQRPSIHTNPRSFVPTSPANSPAEFSRTSSVKEEKENEKDHETLKSTRALSPSVSSGSNRFMMPTISASSKTNPSPRKKMLADKNEPLRTSISFSDLRNSTEKNDQKLHKGFDSKDLDINEDVYDTPTNTNLLPKCPSHNLSESSAIKPVIGSNTKVFDSSISPLDADPSLPPYDPKTNYLSPRPQFLHYRPNPRLEIYYKKEQSTGKINLDDRFSSESSSDTEVSEESQGKSQTESENDSSVEAINEKYEKESDDGSSVEGINEKLEKGSENDSEEVSKDESLVEGINEKPEKEVDKDYSVQAIIEKFEKESKEASPIEVVREVVEKKKVTKTRFFTSGKVISLLLVLSIAFLSLWCTYYPSSNSPIFENFSSSKYYQENFNGFTRNLKLWSDYYSSYVNELISKFMGDEKLNLLQFSNVSSMQEDPFVEVNRGEEIYEGDEVEPVFEYEDEFESQLDNENDLESENLQNGIYFEEKLCPEETASEVIEGDDHNTFDSKIECSIEVYSFGDSKIESNIESPSSEVESSAAYSGFENIIATSLSEVWNLDKGGNSIVSDSGIFQVDSEYDSKISEVTETPDSKIKPITVEDSENTFEIDDSNSLKQFETVTVAISLLAIALIAAPVLIYLKKQKSNIDPKSTKETKKLPAQQSYLPEDDLAQGGQCPSEMSSSYNGKRGTTNEATSQERKHKRVSKMKPSSEISMSDSRSYGSFTTYERLPTKHRYGDDEVVTPVRRSSRIKKIQISSS